MGTRDSPRIWITLALILGLLVAFSWASYLAYWGGVDVSNAFNYQSHVVSAQRDVELLDVAQLDRTTAPDEVRRLEKLLDIDLIEVNQTAGSREQQAPPYTFPSNHRANEVLSAKLGDLEQLGQARFERTVRHNTETRDLSNALFAVVALLFVVVQGRLRRRIEEGRSLVERLQRAFISSRRELRNVDAGTVLISATRGSNVGGDVYDLFTFDRRRGMFMVADVSGKGIDAAVDTALIKYSLRTLLREDGDPGRALSKFGSLYAQSAENPETFVVIFLGVIDLDTGTVRYASAGHEPAWVLFGREVRTLPPTGPIVGIDATADYDTRTILLRPGDGIVVSTDGLTESRDADGALLGADGVTRWLSEIEGDSQTVADTIVQRLRARSSGIADDLAILMVRYAPSVVRSARPVEQELTAQA